MSLIFKYKNSIFSLVFLISFFGCSYNSLYNHVKYLASDSLEGRYPGTEGDILAAEYIRNQFVKNNLDLMGDDGYQSFSFINEVKLGNHNRFSFNNIQFSVGSDFVPLSFSKNTEFEGDVFMAGYGFDIDEDSLKWNDYDTNDIKGKWVMILRGAPDGDNPHGIYSEYVSLRTKALTAKDNHAAGVIFVSGNDFDKNDDLIGLSFERNQQDIGIPVINIKRNIANLLLDELSIEQIESQIKIKKMKFNNFFINKQIKVNVDLVYDTANTQNIIGIINGTDSDFREEYIVIGAHYDHIGYGGEKSGSRRPYLNAVHNGADDNASGVAILIELSKSLNKIKNKRSIIFIAFGGEEMGLLGSKYFMNSEVIPNNKIQIMINMDMVGRLNEQRSLSINGTKTAEHLEDILIEIMDETKFDYILSSEGYGPSDHSSFYLEGVPVLFFFTGAHTDYHTPNDDYDKLNYNGMNEIENLIFRLVEKIDYSDKLLFKKTSTASKGRPTKFKVTLGIMPDYVYNSTKGLRIDIVLPEKPAEKAGLNDGDIIIEIDNKPVSDIYEYMHRLSEIEPGQKVNVLVLRNGKRITHEVIF